MSTHVNAYRESYKRAMAEADLDTQYAMYVCACGRTSPVIASLRDVIARRGEEAVPYLLDKLRQARDGYSAWIAAMILEDMARRKYYDTASDKAVVIAVRQAADRHWDPRVYQVLLGLQDANGMRR